LSPRIAQDLPRGWAAAALLGLVVPGAARAGWVEERWGARDGLLQSSITDIAQDDDGFVWLTGYGGFSRFDGVTFENFHGANIEGLTTIRFLSLAFDRDGDLWLGSDDRGLFRVRDGRAEQIGPPVEVHDLHVDPQGVVWAAVLHGALRVVDDRVEEIPAPGLSSLASWDDGVVGLGPAGQTWCLTGDCTGLPAGPPTQGRQRWVRGPDGALVASTLEAVYEHDGRAWTELHPVVRRDPYNPSPCGWWRGEAWCPAVEAHRDEVGLATGIELETRTVLVDREQGIWVGTDGSGLFRYQWTAAHREPAGESVFDVAEGPPGRVWYGSKADGGSLSTLARGLQGAPVAGARTTALPVDHPIWPEAPGVVLGCEGDGRCYRLSARGLRPLGRRPESQRPFRAAVLGPWASQGAELLRMGEASIERIPLGADEVRPLRGDGRSVWVVLDDERLARWEGGTLSSIVDVSRLASVRDLWEADDGRIWLATYGSGLVALRGGVIEGVLGPEEGSCDRAVSHIYDRGDGSLWLNTNRGLGRVEVVALEHAVAGTGVGTCTLVASGEGNGSQGIVTTDGTLVAPTVEGLAWLRPDEVQPRRPPRLHIEEAMYGSADLLAGDPAQGPGSLRVRFTGLYYRSPRAVRYRYRLRGVEDRWSAPTLTRSVAYHAVPPGSHRLEVQARGLGEWGPVAAVTFVRRPSWHERPLFRWGLPAGLVVFLTVGWWGTRRQALALRSEVARRQRVQRALEAQQIENERIRREMETTRRLEALGRLAAGVAHDFNNLFTVILAYAEMLREHPDPEVQGMATELLYTVERGVEVARGLLQFGRGRGHARRALDLAGRLEELQPQLRRLVRDEVELDVQIEPGPGAVLDAGQLDRIVTNLVINAEQATRGEGVVTVRLRSDGEEVVLEVQDRGVGMTPEQRERAVEPYYTTRSSDRGTGLGLSIVHGIVVDAGGTLSFESSPDDGTTVSVRLPREELEPEPEPEPAGADTLEGLRVLFVEDREDVRRAVQRMFAGLGWDARMVDSLAAAEDALRAGPVDLLISDVVMPMGSGPEVREALRRIVPGLPTLFVSGYVDRPQAIGDSPVLLKPFGREELLRAAQRTLRESPGGP